MGKAMLGLLAGMAEEELDARRQGWAEAHRRAIERGVGMTVPIGYRKGADGRLRIHPGEAKKVKLAFRLRSEGVSLSEIARRIGRSHSTVHEMLGNPVYLGTVKYGAHVKTDAHPAIVDRVIFDLANAARTSRPVPPGELTRDRLLQGIARCAGCGHTLKVVHRPLADGTKVGAYYCKNQAKQACRDRAFVSADLLDEYIEEWFERALKTVPRMVDVVESGRELEQAQTAEADAHAQLAAFVENGDALDRQNFQRGIAARQRRVDEAHELVRSLSARMTRLPTGGSLPTLWASFDRAERHDVLAGFLDRIVVRKGASGDLAGNVEIVWGDGSVAEHERAVRVAAA